MVTINYAKCHLGRPHHAKGLCKTCYQKDYRNKNSEWIRKQFAQYYKERRGDPELKQESLGVYFATNAMLLSACWETTKKALKEHQITLGNIEKAW